MAKSTSTRPRDSRGGYYAVVKEGDIAAYTYHKTLKAAKSRAQQLANSSLKYGSGANFKVVYFASDGSMKVKATISPKQNNPGFIKCKAVRIRKSGKGFKLDILK